MTPVSTDLSSYKQCGNSFEEHQGGFSIGPPFLAGIGSKYMYLVSGLQVSYDNAGNVEKVRGFASDY